MENLRRHRDIKLVTTKRRNYWVSKPNYHKKRFFAENLLAIEMEKNQRYLQSKTMLYRYRCFIVYTKTDDIYKDFADDAQTRFDTLNH